MHRRPHRVTVEGICYLLALLCSAGGMLAILVMLVAALVRWVLR